MDIFSSNWIFFRVKITPRKFLYEKKKGGEGRSQTPKISVIIKQREKTCRPCTLKNSTLPSLSPRIDAAHDILPQSPLDRPTMGVKNSQNFSYAFPYSSQTLKEEKKRRIKRNKKERKKEKIQKKKEAVDLISRVQGILCWLELNLRTHTPRKKRGNIYI